MSVALSCRTAAGGPWQAYLRRRAHQVLAALRLGGYELSLSIVGDEEMWTLNRAYRGRDGPTDVLAFPLHEQAPRRIPPRRASPARRGLAMGVGPRSEFAARKQAPARRGLAMGVGPRSEFADLLLGDVVISIETAAAQARALRRALAERLDTLLVHGVLHLVGYDHEVSAAEARRMARRTREIRAALPALLRCRSAGGRAPRSARRAPGRFA